MDVIERVDILSLWCALFDHNVHVICLNYAPTTLVEQTFLPMS